MPSATLWTATVTPNAQLPTVRSVARDLGLTEHADWTWEQKDSVWHLVVDAQHGDRLADALEAVGYDLTFYARQDRSIEDSVRVQSLVRRLAPLLPDMKWTDPLVQHALIAARPGAPLYRDAVGRWHHTSDSGRTFLRVDVADHTPHWCRAVPGVLYDGRSAVVGLERLYAVALALAPVAPSLAASLLAAHWVEDMPVPTDTDWLCRAPNLAALTPDLQALVGRLAARIPQPRARRLREYQQIAVAFALAGGGRALIADAPGVGKTASALGFLLQNVAEHTPALVVAPASVLSNWVDEVQAWGPGLLRPAVLTEDHGQSVQGSVWITSWAQLARVDVRQLRIRTLVLDEAHYAKHSDSQRATEALLVAQQVQNVLALTGTPLENHTTDLWNLLRILGYPGLPDLTLFRSRYGLSKRKVIRGVVYIDDTRAALLPELRADLQNVMLRRLKSDLALELPEKTRVAVWVDLPPDVRRGYDDAEQHIDKLLVNAVRERRVRYAIKLIDRGEPLAAAVREANHLDLRGAEQQSVLALLVLGYMRQILGDAKVAAAASWIREFRATGEPLVVFNAHRAVRDALRKAMGTGRRAPVVDEIHGGVPPAQRGEIVRRFQAGQIDVLLCSLKAAGVGLNLFRASNVLFVERSLLATEEEQAEDRVWRSGQRNACTAYYLMARDTLDERLDTIISRKRALATDLLREEAVGSSDQSREDLVDTAAAGIFLSRVSQAIAGGVGDTVIREADVRAMLRRQSA